MKLQLWDLPHDVMAEVLLQVSAQDIINLACTCSELHKICTTDDELWIFLCLSKWPYADMALVHGHPRATYYMLSRLDKFNTGSLCSLQLDSGIGGFPMSVRVHKSSLVFVGNGSDSETSRIRIYDYRKALQRFAETEVAAAAAADDMEETRADTVPRSSSASKHTVQVVDYRDGLIEEHELTDLHDTVPELPSMDEKSSGSTSTSTAGDFSLGELVQWQHRSKFSNCVDIDVGAERDWVVAALHSHVALHDFQTGQPHSTITSRMPVWAARFVPAAGSQLAVAQGNKCVLFDVNTMRSIHTIGLEHVLTARFRVEPDYTHNNRAGARKELCSIDTNDTYISLGFHRNMAVFDRRQLKEPCQLCMADEICADAGAQYFIQHCLRGTRWLVAGSEAGYGLVWDLHTGKLRKSIQFPTGEFVWACHASDSVGFFGTARSSMVMLDLASPGMKFAAGYCNTLPSQSAIRAASVCGMQITAVGYDHSVRLWGCK